MKTVLKISLSLLVFGLAVSCGDIAEKEKSEKVPGEKIEVDGSGVEMSFKGFDDDGKAVVSIANKMDKNIDEFRAEVFWLDEDGNQITFATGAPRTTPIQHVQRNVAPSGRVVDFTLLTGLDRAPDGTEGAKVNVISVKFSDKTEWIAE